MARNYIEKNTDERHDHLFQVGLRALKKAGWCIEQVQGTGKPSLRRITKGDEEKWVAIRVSQNTRIRFSRKKDDTGWITLDDSDLIAVISVDVKDTPREAKVHLIDSTDMQERLDRAYKARLNTRGTVSKSWGASTFLYEEDAENPVTYVGAGAGLANPAIYTEPLDEKMYNISAKNTSTKESDEELTVIEAKRRLALTYDVNLADIKIMIEM